MKKKNVLKNLSIFCVIAFFIGINIIYARTTTKLHFCEYPGTIRTLKIIGIFIFICKIVVPLILLFVGIKEFAKVAISGKEDDLKGIVFKLIKSFIAGLVIFFIPTIVNYSFTALVKDTNSSEYAKCSTCLLDFSKCTVPDEDPDLNLPN